MTGVDVANWSVEGVTAKPTKQSVRELADEWIASGMGDAEAQDYLTGEELLEDRPEVKAPTPGQDAENAVLRRRIAELEAQLRGPSVMQATPKAASGPGRVAGLFAQNQASQLSDAEMRRGSSPSGGGRNSSCNSAPYDNSGRRVASGFGEGSSRCRGTSRVDDHGRTAVSRSNAEASLCTTTAKQPVDAEDHGVEATRPGAGSFGVRRRGQRHRKFLRRQRLLGSRSILESGGGQSQTGRHRQIECPEGARLRSRQGGQQLDEEIRGAANSISRPQAFGSHSHSACRGLGNGLCFEEHGAPWCDWQDADFRGAGGDRRWKAASGVAADRCERTSYTLAGEQAEAAGLAAILEVECLGVGCGEFSLSSGPGLSGSQDGIIQAEPAKEGSRQGEGGEAREQEGPWQRQEGLGRPRGRRVKTMNQHSGTDPTKFAAFTQGCLGAAAESCNLFDVGMAPDNFSHSLHKFVDAFHSSDSLDPINLVQAICQGFWSCKSGLTAFTAACRDNVHSCNMHEAASASLWPVPLPRRWTACKHLGPKRRRRHRFLRVQRELLCIVISALNFELLGFPTVPPAEACTGHPLSRDQHEVLERIEAMLAHFLKMQKFQSDDLGRITTKFQDVIRIVKELPTHVSTHDTTRLEDLTVLLQQMHADFDHYSRSSRVTSTCQFDAGDAAEEPAGVDTSVQLPNTGALPVIADRVKWNSPPSFHASEFLEDPLLRAAFDDPDVLRKPISMWPKTQTGRMHCSKDEFLKLAQRWDDLGACSLLPLKDKNFSEAVGIFCVPKDGSHDRLIVNPKTINSRMFSLSNSTKDLAPGCMLGLLHLNPGEAWRFSADDLTDYYYTFHVSGLRARRNAFRMVFESSELSHFKSWDSSMHGLPLLVCLKTLAMGDSLAVEIAQQAHTNVLRKLCGSMLNHETLKYRCPVPRGSFVELLAIDDHIGLQKLPKDSVAVNPKLRDSRVFKAAEKAYRDVGLVQHEKNVKETNFKEFYLGLILMDGKAVLWHLAIGLLCCA